MTATTYPYIVTDESGAAWVEGANTKVVEVALDMIAHGSSVEEMHLEHRHLSLAQIHAALTYYYDHQAEFDQQIKDSLQAANHLRQEFSDSPVRRRLRQLGSIQPG